jgi:hypothetical protein
MGASFVFAVVGVILILRAGNTFGATAFAGGNFVCAVMYMAFRDRWEALARPQTLTEAIIGWVLGLVLTGVTIAVFVWGYNLTGSIIMAVTVIFFALATWSVVFGPGAEHTTDRPEPPDPGP